MSPLETITAKIEELEALEKVATAAPWAALENGSRRPNLLPYFNVESGGAATSSGDPVVICEDLKEKNARFVSEARNSLPALLSALKEMGGALEMYAKGDHFEYQGRDEFAPENPSGEPANIECGGAEGSEFTVENGGIASEALSKAARLLGEK